MRAALRLTGVSSMEEALYLKMQAEQRREFELQQMLVRERLAQESQRETLRQQELKAIGDHLKDFPDLQQQYSRLLIGDPRAEERMILTSRLHAQAEEELRRRQHLLGENPTQRLALQHSPVLLSAAASIKLPGSSVVGSQRHPSLNQSMLRDIAADSLAGNAVRRGAVDRRKFANPDSDVTLPTAALGQTIPPSNTNDIVDLELSPSQQKISKPKRGRKPKKQPISPRSPKAGSTGKRKEIKFSTPSLGLNMLEHISATPSSKKKKRRKSTENDSTNGLGNLCKLQPRVPTPVTPSTALGTIGDLLDAAHTEDRSNEAARILFDIKQRESVYWPESDDEFCEQQTSPGGLNPPVEHSIRLPNFVSVLPNFPEEPFVSKSTPSIKKKHKGLLDDDSVEGEPTRTNVRTEKSYKTPQNASTEDAFKDLPYLVDKWWPSSQSIIKERQARGQVWMVNDAEEKTVIPGTQQKFRTNVNQIKERISHQVQPGVLEKIPYCKIHRMLLQRRKSAAPELVYCWQVTELYPNDMMVGCLHCGTWRHAACGGHHKNFSVRETTEKPFVPMCDRCYKEDKILEDQPLAKKRLDRQRCEQIRRGLSTSAAIRQASFSKHGGTYKWPLGSVSATHIGGHTRSVHTRHDKAEKQWAEMTARLSKGFGKSPKDKIKYRTKELERLLVSVEDAGT
jgi:hypothetical protein